MNEFTEHDKAHGGRPPGYPSTKRDEELAARGPILPLSVFLGGTCNESTWRKRLMAMLSDNIDCYDPVVPDWTESDIAEEIYQKETCDYCLFVITPKMTGVYSIAEVVDSSNKRPGATLFCVLQEDGGQVFTPSQVKSLNAVSSLVRSNGGQVFTSLVAVASCLCPEQEVEIC